jgi:hypothetical protein
MSLWCCQLDGKEIGPMPFVELAALARNGTITETTRVRRANAGAPWSPAWTVVGLLEGARPHATEATTQGSLNEAPTTRSVDGAPTEGHHAAAPPAVVVRRDREGGHAAVTRGLGCAAVALLVTAAIYRRAYWSALRFPPRRLPGETGGGHFFPLVGECNALECALLYFDLFLLVAVAASFAWRWAESKLGTN